MRPFIAGGLVLVAVGCGRAALIPEPDGGNGGGRATGGGSASGGGGATGGGGNSAACDNLDERTCRHTSGCLADTCFTCTCTPTYLGCRTPTQPEHMCPSLGCGGRPCCHDSSACSAFGDVCLAPGGTLGCPICAMVSSTCATDSDCSGGQICEPVACACQPATQCVPGCTSTCPDGQRCDNGAHPRCVAQGCGEDAACPDDFICTNGACARKTCSGQDSDCDTLGGSFCVFGLCYPSLGTCMTLPQ